MGISAAGSRCSRGGAGLGLSPTSRRSIPSIASSPSAVLSVLPAMASVVRGTSLRAGGACVRCRKGKTKCVYDNGRAPCKTAQRVCTTATCLPKAMLAFMDSRLRKGASSARIFTRRPQHRRHKRPAATAAGAVMPRNIQANTKVS
ncbi:hypothetical protein NUW58_g1669 [Xylaria curta]|uniref:Uncharacterized protein n=1 Tax=Xylaria curta TaxID=42375 RepID=A0ACC1PJQ2_9PEZI|nr:hypothetical protein NUW58_g1669 [Xylaria curta]